MAILIVSSLKKDGQKLYRDDLVTIEQVGDMTEREIQLAGYVHGYVKASGVTLMLGHILDPIWEGLKMLRMNAAISIELTEETARIEIKERAKEVS